MAKGMEAVLEKTAGGGKKKAVLAKKVAAKLAEGAKKGPGKGLGKGPGMAVMIAIGGPKKGMEDRMGKEEEPMRDGFHGRSASTEAILAKMEARIAALEAKLAESESEGEGESDGESEGEDDMEEED